MLKHANRKPYTLNHTNSDPLEDPESRNPPKWKPTLLVGNFWEPFRGICFLDPPRGLGKDQANLRHVAALHPSENMVSHSAFWALMQMLKSIQDFWADLESRTPPKWYPTLLLGGLWEPFRGIYFLDPSRVLGCCSDQHAKNLHQISTV